MKIAEEKICSHNKQTNNQTSKISTTKNRYHIELQQQIFFLQLVVSIPFLGGKK
jgi:hypothetical protein